MAVLSDADRLVVSGTFQQDVSQAREDFGAVTKADILAAVNALDNFLNTNAATINAAIPQPARTQLTTAQKARLLTYVIRKRYEKGA